MAGVAIYSEHELPLSARKRTLGRADLTTEFGPKAVLRIIGRRHPRHATYIASKSTFTIILARADGHRVQLRELIRVHRCVSMALRPGVLPRLERNYQATFGTDPLATRRMDPGDVRAFP